jgi:hypothetical protein
LALTNVLLESFSGGLQLEVKEESHASNATLSKKCHGTFITSGLFRRQWLNLYYLNAAGNCENCCQQTVPNAAFLTDTANPTTLAHEVGHALSLGHTCDNENLMEGGAPLRSALRLNQVYRLSLAQASYANWQEADDRKNCGTRCAEKCDGPKQQVDSCVSPNPAWP